MSDKSTNDQKSINKDSELKDALEDENLFDELTEMLETDQLIIKDDIDVQDSQEVNDENKEKPKEDVSNTTKSNKETKNQESTSKEKSSKDPDGNTTTVTKEDKSKRTASTSTKTTSSITVKAIEKSPVKNNQKNLWVSNLSTFTRATDLKQWFSKHGKVIGAKVVTNPNSSRSRCYGYIVMASENCAAKCIERLDGIELHGRVISVGLADSVMNKTPKKENDEKKQKEKRETSLPKENKEKDIKKDYKEKSETKKKSSERTFSTSDKRNSQQKSISVKDKDDSRSRKSSRDRERSRSSRKSMERKPRSRSPYQRRSNSRDRNLRKLEKLREEKDRLVLLARERQLRMEEGLRKERERRAREEELSLLKEKALLAKERERLEREKNELLELERERQKYEREKLELERLELKRQKMKMEEQRQKLKTATYNENFEYKMERNNSNLISIPIDLDERMSRSTQYGRDHSRADPHPPHNIPINPRNDNVHKGDAFKRLGPREINKPSLPREQIEYGHHNIQNVNMYHDDDFRTQSHYHGTISPPNHPPHDDFHNFKNVEMDDSFDNYIQNDLRSRGNMMYNNTGAGGNNAGNSSNNPDVASIFKFLDTPTSTNNLRSNPEIGLTNNWSNNTGRNVNYNQNHQPPAEPYWNNNKSTGGSWKPMLPRGGHSFNERPHTNRNKFGGRPNDGHYQNY